MMKKHFALLLILVVLSSCSEDDQGANIYQEHNFTERLSFDHLPERVKTNLKSNYSKKSKTDFGFIDPEQFVFKNKTKDTNTYTMALRSSQKKSIRYFDNLVVQVDGDKLYYYVFRYTPTEKWLTSGKEQSSYSGEVQIFDFNTGGRVGSLKMQNGVETSPTNEGKVCQWEFTGEVICAQLYGDGDSYGVEVCNYVYRESCGGGDGTSGGDFGNPSHEGDPDPFPTDPAPGGSGSGGDFGSGGPGDIETNPIIGDDGDLIEVECLEGEKPNIFGICEEVEEEIILEDSFKDNDKINCTYEQLLNNNTIQELLDSFFGEDTEYDLNFRVVENLQCNGSNNPSGCTQSTLKSDGSITISIDQDYINTFDNNDTPTLFLARTIVHETIHSNLYLALYEYRNGNTSYLPDINDFPQIYEQYRSMKDWQHEFMANHYVNLMSETLGEIHPYLNDQQFISSLGNYDMSLDDFYSNISYMGLEGTSGMNTYLNNSTNSENYQISYQHALVNSTSAPNCD